MESLLASALVDHFIETFESATGIAISDDRQFDVSVGRLDDKRQPDLLLNAKTPSGNLALVVEIKRQGYPRDIRDAVRQLEEYMLAAKVRGRMAAFVIADALSPGAREILRERGIGYFDSSGSLYLKKDDWLINIDRPPKMSRATRTGNIFTGAKEQVVHALLHAGDAWLTGLEIAESSTSSVYTVSQTLLELERLEWVISQGSGRKRRRRLSQPGKLLDAWADNWRAREQSKLRYFLFAANPKQTLSLITERLTQANLTNWSLTGAAAANVLSPLLTSVDTVEMIVPPGRATSFSNALGAKPVDKGSNLTLLEREGASTLFRQQQFDVPSWFASPFIQFLDLQDGRGRNKELAAELRTNILKI
jgi:hypothetical protein